VLGAKRLKAVAVAGSRRVPVADPEGVVAAAKELSRRSFGPATGKYRELGTGAHPLTFNRLHALPTLNFQQGRFAEAAASSGGARDPILQAARLCDRLGLDTISAGATVAFAMECGGRGLLTADGLRFGNAAALLALLPRIARRADALGDLLAEGTRRAAERIGGDAPDFA